VNVHSHLLSRAARRGGIRSSQPTTALFIRAPASDAALVSYDEVFAGFAVIAYASVVLASGLFPRCSLHAEDKSMPNGN
jgi:hypothetical protein